MRFDGCRWVEVSHETLLGVARDRLKYILSAILQLLHEDLFSIDSNNTMPREDQQRARKAKQRECTNMSEALRYVNYLRNMKNILEFTRPDFEMGTFEDKLDRNGNLLGVNNGVIDLLTCTFRRTEPEDFISKSTGYDYIDTASPEYDPAIMQELEDFISRIYPIEEEREIVQRYGGYCLLGRHPEKIFCIATDVRNGFNGKSKYSKLLLYALGNDYTKSGGENNLLYASDVHHGNANSHSAGLLFYYLIRLALFEETTNSKNMNCGLLKNMNGGGGIVGGRHFGSEKTSQFEWTAKMIINCNDGQMPSFNWQDEAFCERMFVVRHRSKFYTKVEDYEKHKHEPYTYKADPDCDQKIVGIWRPYVAFARTAKLS